jgi:hypothetical protein
MHERVRVLDVERLVEHKGVRKPEVPQSKKCGENGHRERAAPIPDTLTERSSQLPGPPGVEFRAPGSCGSDRPGGLVTWRLLGELRIAVGLVQL